MKSSYDFSEEVVVIIGGAGFLGQRVVKKLIEANAKVVIADRSLEICEKFVEQLKDCNIDKVKCVSIDITSKESINNAIVKIVNTFGSISSVVNCAYPRNPNYGKSFFEVDYIDFCENVNIHLGGYFLCMQMFAKYFLDAGQGNIVNVASVYGLISPRFGIYDDTGMTMPVEYAAIKSSIIHLTKYVAGFLKNKKIRVNSLSPGGLFNNQNENFVKSYNSFCLNKGMLDPEDITGGVLFLLSDASLFINGQNLVIDDGFTL